VPQGSGTPGPDLAGPAHGVDGAGGKVTPRVSFYQAERMLRVQVSETGRRCTCIAVNPVMCRSPGVAANRLVRPVLRPGGPGQCERCPRART